MICRAARAGEEARLKSLWQTCFGDDPETIDPLFDALYRPDRGLVVEDGGEIVSMLLSIPARLSDGQGRGVDAAYFYAFCTHPDAQGKGYGRSLLSWSESRARAQGCGAAVMIPGEASLFGFYQSLGYERDFPRQIVSIPAGEGRGAVLRSVTVEEYLSLREAQLTHTPHAVYPAAFGDGQAVLSRLSRRGGLLAVNMDGTDYPAAVEGWEDDPLVIKELLCPDTLLYRAVGAICAVFHGDEAEVNRTNPNGDPQEGWGVVKWLGEKRISGAYWGIGLE